MAAELTRTERGSMTSRKFYILDVDVRGGGSGHGLVFENEDKLTVGFAQLRPEEGGFPLLKEKPRVRYDKKLGTPPRDMEGGMSGYWFISARLKDIFEAVDPVGFVFADCDYILPDGSLGPQHYLCDVVRILDVLDEENSDVAIEWDHDHNLNVDIKMYSISGRNYLKFRDERIEYGIVFYQFLLPAGPICDSSLFNACKSVKDLRGLWFRDVSHL